MQCFFEARPISSDTLRQAYAVALLGFPALTLPEFRKMVSRTTGGALNGLFDRRGYVHALFRSKNTNGSEQARILVIRDLIISDAISSRLGREMADALTRHAAQSGCDQLTFEVAVSTQLTTKMTGNALECLGFLGVLGISERWA